MRHSPVPVFAKYVFKCAFTTSARAFHAVYIGVNVLFIVSATETASGKEW